MNNFVFLPTSQNFNTQILVAMTSESLYKYCVQAETNSWSWFFWQVAI